LCFFSFARPRSVKFFASFPPRADTWLATGKGGPLSRAQCFFSLPVQPYSLILFALNVAPTLSANAFPTPFRATPLVSFAPRALSRRPAELERRFQAGVDSPLMSFSLFVLGRSPLSLAHYHRSQSSQPPARGTAFLLSSHSFSPCRF